MGRNPEYSFHLLEEQISNITDNLLIKYDMAAIYMALRGRRGEKGSNLYLL